MIPHAIPPCHGVARWVPAVLLFACSACSDESAANAWPGTVRDSAGITVVENPSEGLWAEGEGWTLTEELRIGALQGPPAYQFGSIATLAVDEGDRVWVADSQAQEVRVFDPGGVHVRTLGRPGSGPGELGQLLPALFVLGGEAHVVDLANQRVKPLSRRGRGRALELPIGPHPGDSDPLRCGR